MNLIALGLLLHQSVYLSSRGFRHFCDDLAPALGLHLGSWSRLLLNIALCLLTSAVLYSANNRFYLLLLTLVLGVLIAAFPRRLPNHLPVALMMLLCFTVSDLVGQHDYTFDPMSNARRLVSGVFFFAAFHKLNRTFFRPESSCGAGLFLHYLLQRGIHLDRQPLLVTIVGVYATIVAELSLPPLLSIHSMVKAGVVLAVLVLTIFGFLGHVHFTVIMFGGLTTFLNHPVFASSILAHWRLAFLSCLVAFICGNYRKYKYRPLAILNQCISAVIATEILRREFADTTVFAANWTSSSLFANPWNLIILVIFAVNVT